MAQTPEKEIEAPDLFEAARAAGVEFCKPALPEDRHVSVNGLRLHYLDWGDQGLPPLVFLHGTAQQAHSWDFAALSLRHKFRVLALDQRGHGDSEWAPDGDYSSEAYVADVAGFVDALELAGLALCGLSMGGRNAYQYASRRPKALRALIVVESAPVMGSRGRARIDRFMDGPQEFDEFEAIVMRVQAYTPHRSLPKIRGSLRNSTRQLPNGKWGFKYDPRIRGGVPVSEALQVNSEEGRWRALSLVRCPTLFVIGEESGMIDDSTASRMVDAVPGSEVARIPRAGHLVAGDNPTGFNVAVSSFLDRLETPHSRSARREKA